MPTATLTQTIDRPVAEVFDTAIHVERFPEWSPKNHKSARRLSAGETGASAASTLFHLAIAMKR